MEKKEAEDAIAKKRQNDAAKNAPKASAAVGATHPGTGASGWAWQKLFKTFFNTFAKPRFMT
jgi:hypothetical protein